MEELKTLKELFDAGFMPKDEYEKRRIDIVNRITGSSFGSGTSTPSASVSISAPAPVAVAVQTSTSAPAPVQELDDTAVLLGELSLDDDALWDELDALANVGPSKKATTASAQLQPSGAFPMATLRPSQGSTLQPTNAFAAGATSATLRQPAMDVNQMATLRQPQSQPQPQAQWQGQSATLRHPQAAMANEQSQFQAQTLRAPAQFYSETSAYGGGHPSTMRETSQLQQPLAMQAMGMTNSGAQNQAQVSSSASVSRAVPSNSAPSEFRGAPSLQSHAMAAKSSSKTAMMDMVGGGSRGGNSANSHSSSTASKSAKPYTWEFFHAAQNNNVKKLSDLLEIGVDVNQRDTDTSNSALHLAAMRGQKHAIYFLIDQGADIDAQNRKGSTPLHLLVNNRFNNLAVWMVKQGADINIEDIRGFTPYDMALPWLQKEMKEAMYGRTRTARTQQQINRVFGELSTELHPEVAKEAQFQKAQQLGLPMDSLRGQIPPSQAPQQEQQQSSALVQDELDLMMGMAAGGATVARGSGSGAGGQAEEQEVMKIYLKNGSYKSLLIKTSTMVGDVCAMMAGKLNLEEHSNSFDLLDVQREKSRRLDPTANVLKLKSQWPLILGKKGNETEKYCKFVVVPKRGTSEAVQKLYRRAMHK